MPTVGVGVALSFALLLLTPAASAAHPGRLDPRDGCHTVRRDFQYESGIVAKRGERHRGLDRMKLDGSEVFQNEGGSKAPKDEGPGHERTNGEKEQP